MRRFKILMTSLPLLVIIFLNISIPTSATEESDRHKPRMRRVLIERTVEFDEASEVAPEVDTDPIADDPTDEILEGKDLYIQMIYDIQQAYFPNLDQVIVQAVMETESNYIPTVQSKCGAVGLMQVIPKWHAWRMDKYGLTDIWDPYTNILVGMDFLNESLEKYGSYYQALLAYNNSSSYVEYVLWRAEQIRQGGV